MNSLIASKSKGRVNAVLTQNRRFMSISSAFSSSPVTTRGSSVIPQIGQKPGASRTICGCIGQVYSIFSVGGVGMNGSRVISHFGHEPGCGWRISGCIGQVYLVLAV